MERDYYSQRGQSILLGSSNREIQSAYYTSPSTPSRNSEVDFNDVFGGPPRRSSVSEMRHSHSFSRLQSQDLSGDDEEGGEGPSCPWPPEGEKPVFGEDNGNRRRYPNRSNDFFDDIFGGEESPEMRRDRDPFSGRVLIPARPLPSPAESLASSLPSTFSLPAKMDLPAFGSSTRSRNPLNSNNNGIISSNGSSSSDSLLSRFSPQATKQKEFKKDSKPSYRQSLLSKEFSDQSTSDRADNGSNSEVSPSNSNGQFHFSIYKWASKGVPMDMPLRANRRDKFKLERCSSAKDRIVSDITTQNNASSWWKNKKQADSTATYKTIQNGADSIQIVEQIASAKVQPDALTSIQTVIKDVSGIPTSSDAEAESSTLSVSEIISFSGKTEATRENQKLESKSLRFFLSESNGKQGYNEMTRTERREESKKKSTKKPSAVFDVNVNPKTREENKNSSKGVEYSNPTPRNSSKFGENMEGNEAKGKVKEFVRIFNQEAVAKPRVDSISRGSAYKHKEAFRTKNEGEGYYELSKKENSDVDPSNMPTNDLPRQDISESAMPDISFAVIGDQEQSFDENFTVEVLAEDENDDLQNKENQEIQDIDNKIRQWSKGKEGNIRSLLSTLQYVLWPGCGWKPVPLVDVIEANAVKRAYQRALLCLHPDKLQQKGAASHQKYIAENVFDILQEAWSQFNLVGAI